MRKSDSLLVATQSLAARLSLLYPNQMAEDPGCNQPRRRPSRAAGCSRPPHGRALLILDRCNTDGMATYIYFAGAGVHVKVGEDPSDVADAFTSAGGLPVRLTGQDHRGEVYINPATVAFWSASEPSPDPVAPQESSPPTSERQGCHRHMGEAPPQEAGPLNLIRSIASTRLGEARPDGAARRGAARRGAVAMTSVATPTGRRMSRSRRSHRDDAPRAGARDKR